MYFSHLRQHIPNRAFKYPRRHLLKIFSIVTNFCNSTSNWSWWDFKINGNGDTLFLDNTTQSCQPRNRSPISLMWLWALRFPMLRLGLQKGPTERFLKNRHWTFWENLYFQFVFKATFCTSVFAYNTGTTLIY